MPIKPNPDDSLPKKRLTKLERQQFKLKENLKEVLVGNLLGDLYIQKDKLGRLSKKEKAALSLSPELGEILVGLILGDLNIQKQGESINARCLFAQGSLHKDYLDLLYLLFRGYCATEPKVSNLAPHKKTGMIHSRVTFSTLSLPCFNDSYNLFYVTGKKIVPSTIGSLLTLRGLAFLICDDGCWDSQSGRVVLSTNSFTIKEVELLVRVLNDKWDLNCYKVRQKSNYVIKIPAHSIPLLQSLLKDKMPPMMLYKIGL